MSELATGTYEDSRATRVATVIALIYLPASLVLVSGYLNSLEASGFTCTRPRSDDDKGGN